MHFRHLALPVAVLAFGATGPQAATAAPCVTTVGTACTELRASLHFDEGNYRKAPKGTRPGMSRAARSAGMLSVTDHSAWYIGTIDASIGYVCGERDGYTGGVQVVKRKGRWSAPKNPSSGAIQGADYYCGALDD